MAAILSPSEVRRRLTAALDGIEADQVYYGGQFLDGYRYHGLGSRNVDFPRSDNSDGAMFLEKMTGRELADAIRGEIGCEIAAGNVARRAVGLPEIPTGSEPKPHLPEGWTEVSPGGMATNRDPVNGGIVDCTMVTREWFAVFNRDDIPLIDGFSSRDDAFRAFEERLQQEAENEVGGPAPGR